MLTFLKPDIQLFAGEGFADEGAPSAKSAPSAESISPAADKAAGKAEKSGSVVNAGDDGSQKSESEEPQKASGKKPSFEELMRDPEYNRCMSETVSKRIAKIKAAEETLSKISPFIERIAKEKGLEGDLQSLDLERLFSTENGENTPKIIPKEKFFSAIYPELLKMREAMRGVDIREQFKNPVFLRLISGDNPLSPTDAYFLLHRDEIEENLRESARREGEEHVLRSIKAGKRRPSENGIGGSSSGGVGIDYRSSTKKQRDELKRQIIAAKAAGRKIYPSFAK